MIPHGICFIWKAGPRSVRLALAKEFSTEKKDFVADILAENERTLNQGPTTSKAYQNVLRTSSFSTKVQLHCAPSSQRKVFEAQYDKLKINKDGTPATVKNAVLRKATRVGLQMVMRCGRPHDVNAVKSRRQGQKLALRQFGPLNTQRTGDSATAINV